MQKVLTAEEMREVDRLTTEKYGIPSIILMENAAHATARIITEKLGGSVKGKSFLILCGKGNNGGDGAALARILWTQGATVQTYLFGKITETRFDARTNFESLKKISDCEFHSSEKLIFDETWHDYWYHTAGAEIDEFDVVVDSFFGTGLTRPLENSFDTTLHMLAQKNRALYVSVDLPSGLDADKSLPIGQNFQADLTVTFTSPKLANVMSPASDFNGKLHIVNIGTPLELIDNCTSKIYVAEEEDIRRWTVQTRFSPDSYKSKRGTVLLIAGSKRFSGAAVLAANGAMQSGVGLVTVVTSESASDSVSERVLPEVMVQEVEETASGSISEDAFKRIQELSDKADVIGIGSGLGSDEESTRDLVRKVVVERTTPVVIDADGLNSLSPFDLQGSNDLPLVLTPHEGEFLRLLGTDDNGAIKDRVKAVRDFVQKHSVILVLKGERTLIGEPGGKVVINPTGNSGLGKAGNGDNLMGILTGFIGQAVQAEVDIFETVVAAVYIAGLAGDIAEKKFGRRTMLASDVRECLVDAFAQVEQEV